METIKQNSLTRHDISEIIVRTMIAVYDALYLGKELPK